MPTPPRATRDPDAPRILIVLAYFLRRQGFVVSTAACGEDALAAFETQTFGLVLLDVVMPGIGGLETLRTLRSRYPASVLPVIMVTGLDAGDDVSAALALDASDYVTKPYQLADALVRIETVLARTGSSRQA
jgi:DNA-binding response OmpR family regulator